MTTRRAFLQSATIGAGAIVVAGSWRFAFAASSRPLLESVRAACRRLGPLGWQRMLLDVTGGELDIGASDLGAELTKPLSRMDRSYPGFGDFDLAATRAIEAGRPERSLLYHALAAPTVVAERNGTELGGFPTLAEIDAVENYVYGVSPPTLDDLRQRAGGKPLGLVVFALEYRNTPDSVHGRHAELVFSRTGIARLGTIGPSYDAKLRNFSGLDPEKPFEFRVVPQRFAAYIAVQRNGDKASFGPQDALPGDGKLAFWVPIHKLFTGRECIAGLDLELELERDLRNDVVAKFHEYLDLYGYQNNWRGEDLENFPFLIRNERIGSFSSRREYGAGVIEPKPAPLATVAEYEGRPLTFPVDPSFVGDAGNFAFSSMQVIPGPPTTEPSYMYDTAQETQRPAPEYLNIRHRVLANGKIDNLNNHPDMMSILRAGGYQTQHYIDFTGDGWVKAHSPQLDSMLDANMAAYCIVGPPDFYPKVSQRELMLWWQRSIPKSIRAGFWAVPPLVLSQTRIAANIELPVGFSIEDTTITALVTQPQDRAGPVQTPNGPLRQELSGLPDTSPGLFDPGWDTSQGIYFTDKEDPLQKFLAGYGLGSPFVEDAKLCAAYGAYWPGVSPDATRAYQPDKALSGISYPWPTIAPMTDEEIGIVPAANGKPMPWDGVRGPQVRQVNGRPMCAYTDAMRADYLDIMGTMTAALTARVDFEEYKARVLSMAAVYWALGIREPEVRKRIRDEETALIKITRAKSAWAVRSFRPVAANDTELDEAERATKTRFTGPKQYRFDIYRWGKQTTDPADMRVVLVEMKEQAVAYVDGTRVLLRRGPGPWAIDASMPTS